MPKPLTVAITCYPTIGGSGIVAAELGNELARRGHAVRFISYQPPFRLDLTLPNVTFHQVQFNEYELFKYPDYTLPLAVKMCQVHQQSRLDILHVHYAVPHATAALLARQILCHNGEAGPRVITTLHGTDITLLGQDPSLQPIIVYSIAASHGVTAVSESLKRETLQTFGLRQEITVIHNFFTPKPPTQPRAAVRRALGVAEGQTLAIHLSNLRPVKRLPDVLDSLARLPARLGCKLLVVAGGDFSPYQPLVEKLGLGDRVIVRQHVREIETYLSAADLGLYASATESFGMGILECQSFGLPVVASNVGGIPEVVEDGVTGLLGPVGDVAGLAERLQRLVTDPTRRTAMGVAARRRAVERFSTATAVDRYEAYYRQVLATTRPDGIVAA